MYRPELLPPPERGRVIPQSVGALVPDYAMSHPTRQRFWTGTFGLDESAET